MDDVDMAHADRSDRMRVVVTACVVALAASAPGCGVRALDRETRSPRVIAAGCPAVMPGTSNATEDFADMLVWEARTYISTDAGVLPAGSSPGPARPGSEVGEVTCSMVDGPLSGVSERLVNLPWPDGTATALSQGTAIYAVRGMPTKCVLAAHRDGSLVTYVAIDINDRSWPPLC
jgi:hypothetical protein